MSKFVKISLVTMFVMTMVFMFSGIAKAAFDVKHLMIYWDCNEGSGDKLKDKSGRGYDGTAQGKGMKWIKGVYGGGIQLTKTYVEAAGDGKLLVPVDSSKQISFGGWIQLLAHTNYNGFISILSADEGDCCDYRLMVSNTKNPFWNAGMHNDKSLANYTFDLNKWHHYVATMDGTTKIYIDGKLIGEVKDPITPPFYKKVVFWLGTGEGPATWLVEDSMFDDIFAADKVLTEDEIKTIMGGNFMAVEAQGKLASTWASIKQD